MILILENGSLKKAKKKQKESKLNQQCEEQACTNTSRIMSWVKVMKTLLSWGKTTKRMAQKVIEVGLAPVSGFYGSEVTLYYPGLYAGSTDLVGIHNDKETIIDFKQANRPKKEEWIGDYKLQAGAYAMAHDHVHGSNIEQCVIMVCTPDLYYQEFKIDGLNLRKAKHDFLKRLDQYHELLREEEEKPTYGT